LVRPPGCHLASRTSSWRFAGRNLFASEKRRIFRVEKRRQMQELTPSCSAPPSAIVRQHIHPNHSVSSLFCCPLQASCTEGVLRISGSKRSAESHARDFTKHARTCGQRAVPFSRVPNYVNSSRGGSVKISLLEVEAPLTAPKRGEFARFAQASSKGGVFPRAFAGCLPWTP
jgi:hypothetical protein